MFDKLEIFQLSSGMARHAGQRQSAIARNVAHADTPGYRSVDIPDFSEQVARAQTGSAMRATRAGHFAMGPGSSLELRPERAVSTKPNGNSVSIEREMVRAAETRQQHNTSIAIYKSTIDILRSSLGR